MDINRSYILLTTLQALLNWMRDVITERNLEAEWGEAEAEDEYPSAAASTRDNFHQAFP